MTDDALHLFYADGHEFLLQGPRSLIWQEDSPHLQDFQETVGVMDSCHITTGARPRLPLASTQRSTYWMIKALLSSIAMITV
ncbi:hypothetical protein Celaphus_00004114 [Cervus elaphus hippelaphus]|uniref:Uncharacterized protein n=1 Tax=Cervus elaphus hippelaphus TaxID=46360 RepID=A0A212DCJ9_CEREH|nr:hypothetical protein Celaphus_00004114 [Cervus elaphus hippelaphus]